MTSKKNKISDKQEEKIPLTIAASPKEEKNKKPVSDMKAWNDFKTTQDIKIPEKLIELDQYQPGKGKPVLRGIIPIEKYFPTWVTQYYQNNKKNKKIIFHRQSSYKILIDNL